MESSQLYINRFRPVYLDDYNLTPSTLLIFETMLKMDTMCMLLIGGVASGKTAMLNTMLTEYYRGVSQKYEPDVMNINNLKDHGINYYKSHVKTFCQTKPCVRGKKKVIVLDNLDLLNEQSQQVFRNSMDKYGDRVHFIASCTNSQKVIESLQSRFINIKLKPIQTPLLCDIVRKIKTADGLSIDEDAEAFIVDNANNIVKNVINSMEKIKLMDEHITLELAMDMCVDIHFNVFDEYIALLSRFDLSGAIRCLYAIYERGYSVIDILDNFFIYIKHTPLLTDREKYDIIPIICKYITIFNNVHEDEVELGLLTNNMYTLFTNFERNKGAEFGQGQG